MIAIAWVPARADIAPPPDPWTLMDMLEGHWRSQDKGRTVDEVWLGPEGTLMVGMSRTTEGLSQQFEYLRIERRKSGIVYIASPQGRNTTEFTLTQWSSASLRFENEQNDWPQIVNYRRTSDTTLEAEVSGKDKGKERGLTFRWTKVK